MRRFSSYSAVGVIALSAFTLFISSCSSDKSASAPAKATLDLVKERGVLHCGVTSGLPGFSQPDTNNVWSGVDVDICRGVAAAVLGDANKVKYFPLTAKDRFTALSSGEIDILSRNTTWTMSRDTGLGLSFAGVNYYDGQGFMVNKKLNAKSAKDLNGATFCIQSGTTTELNLADYAKAIGIQVTPITSDTFEQALQGLQDRRCDVLTSDQSQLEHHVSLLELKAMERLGTS